MSSSTAAPLICVYLESYRYALNNRFTSSQLDTLLRAAKPLFVCGSLMIAGIIAKILNDDVGFTTDADGMLLAVDMTSAHLNNYKRLLIKGHPYPAIVSSTSSGDIVEGLVIFGLTVEQLEQLNDCYDDSTLPYHLKSVEVEILLAPCSRKIINAETYVWAGSPGQLMEVSVQLWALEEYLKDYCHGDLLADGR